MRRALATLGGLGLAIACSQFPEYAQQYEQRLGGAVDELRIIVADFDADARKFGLSREEALGRYAASPDPFIMARGPTIDVAAYATAAYPSAPALVPEQWELAHATEFGGFGSYWRFDHLYFLKNSFGGGARIAYAWSDRLSIEVAGDFTKTVDTAAVQNVAVSTVSGFWLSMA